eukprot:symbB.v1.2.006811.t1/scaffold409.1/size210228/14
MQLPASCFMQPPASFRATIRLRSLDSADALEALDEMWKLQAEVNVFHLSAVVGACGKDSDWKSAWHLISQCNLSLDVVSFNSLVQCCAKASRWDSAIEVLERMMSGHGLPPTDKTRSTAAGACAGASLWQETMYLAAFCREDQVACNTLITSCGRTSLWHTAQHVAEEVAFTMQPDMVTLAGVLTAYTSASQWRRALHVPREMQQTADAVLYSSLMMACSEGTLWKESLQLLSEMSTLQCLPDLFSYSTVISTCGAADEWQLALSLYQDLMQEQQLPNVVVYSATMAAMAKGNKWQDVLEMLVTAQLTRENANEVSLMAALDACGPRQWQMAVMLMASCHSLRIQVSQSSYTVALRSTMGLWEQCLSLMAAMQSSEIAPNEITLSSTTSSCERSACWLVALSLLDHQVPSMNFLRMGSVIGACENVLQWRETLVLLNSMGIRGLQRNVMTCNSALSACAAVALWRWSLELYRCLQSSVSPTGVTGSAVLSACQRSRSWMTSVRMLKEMRQRKLEPQDAGVKASVLCCSQGHQWSLAMQVSQMLQVSSRIASYAYIAQSCEDVGCSAAVPALLHQMSGLRWTWDSSKA